MMTKEIVIERYGAAPLHDGQRRLGGLDAAAPARRELPGPARRAHDEPGLPGPHGPGAWARSTAACSMHYFWPTSPLTHPGTRSAPPNPLFPTAALAAAGVGQQPDEPGQPLRAEGAALRRRPHGARPASGRRLRAARRAQIWTPDEPDRRALRDLRLHARDLRRHGHARRAERQGQARDRQRRRPVRAERAAGAARSRRSSSSTSTRRSAGSTSTATSRPSARQPTRPRSRSSTRPAASTAARARRTSRRSTTAPAPRWTTRASTRRCSRSPTARGSTGRTASHDNQVLWLSRTGRRRSRTSST